MNMYNCFHFWKGQILYYLAGWLRKTSVAQVFAFQITEDVMFKVNHKNVTIFLTHPNGPSRDVPSKGGPSDSHGFSWSDFFECPKSLRRPILPENDQYRGLYVIWFRYVSGPEEFVNLQGLFVQSAKWFGFNSVQFSSPVTICLESSFSSVRCMEAKNLHSVHSVQFTNSSDPGRYTYKCEITAVVTHPPVKWNAIEFPFATGIPFSYHAKLP